METVAIPQVRTLVHLAVCDVKHNHPRPRTFNLAPNATQRRFTAFFSAAAVAASFSTCGGAGNSFLVSCPTFGNLPHRRTAEVCDFAAMEVRAPWWVTRADDNITKNSSQVCTWTLMMNASHRCLLCLVQVLLQFPDAVGRLHSCSRRGHLFLNRLRSTNCIFVSALR